MIICHQVSAFSFSRQTFGKDCILDVLLSILGKYLNSLFMTIQSDFPLFHRMWRQLRVFIKPCLNNWKKGEIYY